MVKVKKDLTGRRFGKLVVLEQAEDHVDPSGCHVAQWLCLCDCGSKTVTRGTSLKQHITQSCGCQQRKNVMGRGICDISCLPKDRRTYGIWRNMICRCTDGHSSRIKEPTYESCTICDEWLIFSRFKEWFDQNSLWCAKEPRIDLDKDILYKANKLYSPQTCVVVPHSINMLFVKNNKSRGELPVGVSYDRTRKKYKATIGKYDRHVYLGRYDTPEEAFQAYKKAKEQHIKDVADEYKSKYPDFPQKLYDAMYAYEVEITD